MALAMSQLYIHKACLDEERLIWLLPLAKRRAIGTQRAQRIGDW